MTNYSKAWAKYKDSSDYRKSMTELFNKGILHPYSENILRGAFDAGYNQSSAPLDKEQPLNVEEEKITHFHIADNSDAFRDWLSSVGVEFIPNGHFTSISIKEDIFRLGAEFGIYKKEHQHKNITTEEKANAMITEAERQARQCGNKSNYWENFKIAIKDLIVKSLSE